MASISDIVRTIGSRSIAKEVGVGETAVFNAVSKGAFPSKWYLVIQGLCDKRGIDCPSDLFSFASGASSEDAA